MPTDTNIWLQRIFIVLPLGIGTVVCCWLGFQRIRRFFMVGQQKTSKARFMDNLLGFTFIYLGAVCILTAVLVFQVGVQSLLLAPYTLCGFPFVIPICVLGAYWQSYISYKLWGGFLPLAQANQDIAQSSPIESNLISPQKINIPRRTLIAATLVALSVFFGLYALLAWIGWDGNPIWGFLFRIFFSGLMALGIFTTITSAALSNRVRKLRKGERLDDDDDI